MTAFGGGDARTLETAHPVGFPVAAGLGQAGSSPEAVA